MRSVINEFVERNESVRNCVLSVMKGDGSYSWSGGSGIANQENQLPMKEETPVYVASITKLFTATVIMRLFERNKLVLDDPMSKYLPEKLIRGIHVYHGTDYTCKITIKELLSHTSGIADYYSDKPKGGKSLFEIFLEEPERSWTPDDTIERAQNVLEPNFAPGTDASYSDTNFQLLGKIIEAITGRPLYNVYSEFLFLPLGLTHTWLTGNFMSQSTPRSHPADVFYKNINIAKIRSNGSYWADGGIVSTVTEMIIFLKALNEGQIVSTATLNLMKQWHKLRQIPLQYGFGMMYFKLPWYADIMRVSSLYGHSGSIGSFLYYSEDLDLYIAGSINQVDLQSKSYNLIQSVIKALYTKA
jgi:D-alanyl-D-alanine carboxypeptidase